MKRTRVVIFNLVILGLCGNVKSAEIDVSARISLNPFKGNKAAAADLSAKSTAGSRPNILFIATDDLRNDAGCYGNTEVKTPNIDSLAQRGVLFERAYCQQALCNPSRSSLLSGRRPDTLRQWDLNKHFRDELPDVVTLPQYFKNNGYFTQNVGKIFHNWRTAIQGDPASWDVPAQMHFLNHHHDKPIVEGELPPDTATTYRCECRDVPDNAYYDGRVTDLALTALRDCASHKQPFFLAVGFWKPHTPYNAPKRYWDMYDRDKISLPANPEWPKDTPRIAWHDSRELRGKEGRVFNEDQIRELRHGYYAVISYMDAQLGRLLDELERLGLNDNTIIVFWSDHGFHLGEHTLFAKTSNFELDARVPMIIAAPGLPGGRRTRSLAALLDLYPTLSDLAGLPPPQGVEGKSLLPVLYDSLAEVHTSVLTQHPREAYYTDSPNAMGYSVRTDRFRYTEWRDWNTGKPVARELYDHSCDERETVNRVESPEFAADVAACAALLREYNLVAGKPGRMGKPASTDHTGK